MAIFKVGQRVRLVNSGPRISVGDFPRVKLHAEGTITAPLRPLRYPGTDLVRYAYSVLFDGIDSGLGDGTYGCEPWMLAPLTDPKADEFIESVKKWGPLHEEPKVEPAKVWDARTGFFPMPIRNR